MEQRISKWITNVVGGSYIVAIIVIALVWLVVALLHGDFEILFSPTTHKFTIVGVLYLLSLYVVATLPNKSVNRRLSSWVYSIAFHIGLLIYLSSVFEVGGAIVAVGLVESLIAFLSMVGLCFCIYSSKKV